MTARIDVWTFRALEEGANALDLVGYRVEAVDGSIGKIDQATDEVGSSYVVVDTGPWIFGSRVLLPAHVIAGVDREAQTVTVDRTREEIRSAPSIQDVMPDSPRAHQDLGDYYRNLYL